MRRYGCVFIFVRLGILAHTRVLMTCESGVLDGPYILYVIPWS